jgi:DNA ligase-associated metallophosphoesterase
MKADCGAKANTISINIEGEELVLLPQRAMLWKNNNSLFVADAHFGKGTTFRLSSVPIPSGTTQRDLSVLSELIFAYSVRRLVFLGDFMHAPRGMTDYVMAQLTAWRQAHQEMEITLVKGNHDRKIEKIAKTLHMTVEPEPHLLHPFALKHHPIPSDTHYVLCGHTHPAVRLIGEGRQRERLPCFSFSANLAILPAFGSFTGCQEIEPVEGQRIFVVADESVIEVF